MAKPEVQSVNKKNMYILDFVVKFHFFICLMDSLLSYVYNSLYGTKIPLFLFNNILFVGS